jgi:hypothetical protein
MNAVIQEYVRESVAANDVGALESSLLIPGAVKPGFNLIPGPGSMVRWIEDRILDLLSRDATADERPIYERTPESRIGRILWIDSGHSFDPARVEHAAARRGLDPRRVLRSIHVAHPFSAYQLAGMLAAAPAKGAKNLLPLVVISDLVELFYDPELRSDTLDTSFERYINLLAALSERAVVMGLLRYREAPAGRRHLPRQIR